MYLKYMIKSHRRIAVKYVLLKYPVSTSCIDFFFCVLKELALRMLMD